MDRAGCFRFGWQCFKEEKAESGWRSCSGTAHTQPHPQLRTGVSAHVSGTSKVTTPKGRSAAPTKVTKSKSNVAANKTFDDSVVQQLGRFWGINKVLGDFGILRIYVEHLPNDHDAFAKAAGPIFESLERFSLMDAATLSALRKMEPNKVEAQLSNIEERLAKEHDEAFETLRKIKASVVKACSWLEAECRFDRLPWEGVIWSDFKNEEAISRLRVYRDEKSELPYSKGPKTAYEARKASHYELAIGLCHGSPDRYVLEFERWFQDDLTSIISNWEDYHASDYANFARMPELVSPQPFDVCFSLWLWSDIPKFRTRFRQELDKLLPLLFRFMLPNGTLWLPVPRKNTENEEQFQKDHTPGASLLATCLLTNALFALEREDWVEHHAMRACEWIASKQKSDGGWSDDFSLRIDKADVLATYLAIEALQRSGEVKFRHHISQGRDKLLALQTDSGAWETEFMDTSLITRKIINHYSFASPAWGNGTVEKLDRSGREFVQIAKQLLEQGGDANTKMSIIALTHGLEFQLYAMLSASEGSGGVFQKNGQHTIGARDALAKLQEYLVTQDEVREGSALRYQSQLSLMLSTRDSIVHKNASVSKSDVIQWISEVEAFVRHYLKRR